MTLESSTSFIQQKYCILHISHTLMATCWYTCSALYLIISQQQISWKSNSCMDYKFTRFKNTRTRFEDVLAYILYLTRNCLRTLSTSYIRQSVVTNTFTWKEGKYKDWCNNWLVHVVYISLSALMLDVNEIFTHISASSSFVIDSKIQCTS